MFTAVVSDDTSDEDSSGDGAAADMTGVSADDGDLYTFNIVDEDLDNIEQQTTKEVHIQGYSACFFTMQRFNIKIHYMHGL